jgi:hypothetical protein
MNKKLERLLNEKQYGKPSYATLKKQGNELADILEYTEFKKWSGRIRASGEYIKISTDENEKNKISKQLSMIRNEPLTAHHLQQKTWAQFNANLPVLLEKNPNHVWLFITLTIPNCHVENLRSQYEYLNLSFANLLKMKELKKYFSQNGQYYKNKNGERNCGYFKILEASKSTEFNHCKPHLHVLFHMPRNFEDSKNYISTNKLQKLWMKACNINYLLHVNIVRIENDEDLVLNVAGFSSYMTKPHNILEYSKNYIIKYLQQIENFKLSTYSGTLKIINKSSDYQKSDSPHDDNNYKCMKYNIYSNKYEEHKVTEN